MTTDRDRLAADLTTLIVDIEEERLPVECMADECSHADGEHPEPGVHCGDGKRLADRLIALGWTRLEVQGHGYTCGWCPWGRDQYRTMDEYAAHATFMNHRGEPLDEERLARAMRKENKRSADPEDQFSYEPGEDPIYDRLLMEEARRIAKAYREDTEQTT